MSPQINRAIASVVIITEKRQRHVGALVNHLSWTQVTPSASRPLRSRRFASCDVIIDQIAAALETVLSGRSPCRK